MNTFLILFSLVLLATKIKSEGCVAKDFGASSIVCVCTADNCDFLDPYTDDSISGGAYRVYVTSKDGLRLSPTDGHFETNVQKAQAATLTVNKGTTYQEILGFGGAITDTVGNDVRDMVDPLRENFYRWLKSFDYMHDSYVLHRTYFGEGGAQYSLIRFPMGGSDFSESAYTYDDVNEEDMNLDHFALREEDTALKIPILNRANAVKGGEPLKVFSAPWFAPQWMREDPSSQIFTLSEKYFDVWANYFIKYLDAYAEQGINFWGVTPQNEPTSDTWVRYDVDKIADFTGNHLIPALQNAGYGDIKVMLLDDNRDHLPAWVDSSLQNENIKQFAAGTAVHWYADDNTDPNVLTQAHDVDPSKFLLYTESCELRQISTDRLGDWDLAEQYGKHMLEAFNNWVVGWTEWNIVLDMTGGGTGARNHLNSPIIVDNNAQEFYKQPPFYVESHFSMFVPPGSKHIDLSNDNSDLQTVAFLTPDNVVVVIIMNTKDEAISTVISDSDHGNISINIEPRSFSTVLYK